METGNHRCPTPPLTAESSNLTGGVPAVSHGTSANLGVSRSCISRQELNQNLTRIPFPFLDRISLLGSPKEFRPTRLIYILLVQ